MMSSDRRSDPRQGLLLYLKQPDMKMIEVDHLNKRGGCTKQQSFINYMYYLYYLLHALEDAWDSLLSRSKVKPITSISLEVKMSISFQFLYGLDIPSLYEIFSLIHR